MELYPLSKNIILKQMKSHLRILYSFYSFGTKNEYFLFFLKKIMGLKGAEATAKENREYDYSLQIHLHYAELSSLDMDIRNMNMKRSAKFKTLNTVNLN